MEDQSRLPRPVELNRRVFFQIAAAGSALQAPAAQQTPGADPGAGAESKAIYVDLSRCQPASALSKTPRPRQWRLLDYETKTLKGSMIVAGENTDAPELRLPLGTSGWHRIYVGVYPFSVSHIFQYDRDIEDDEFRVELRLSDEKTSTMVTHRGGAHGRIDDFFWKAADTGRQEEEVVYVLDLLNAFKEAILVIRQVQIPEVLERAIKQEVPFVPPRTDRFKNLVYG